MMKKIFLFTIVSAIASIPCWGAIPLKVEVKNPSSLERTNELVEIDWETVNQSLVLKGALGSIVVNDEKGKQVPYQIIFRGEQEPQSLVFLVSVKPKAKSVYNMNIGNPEIFTTKTFGRYVPERLDDFTWENDRIAFRMYGPKLYRDKPTNGVDVWLKRTDELIVDKFYAGMKKGLIYHIDNGQGLDCYKVGNTLGAGGIAPFLQDTLWLGKFYDAYKVLDNGPLRISFELTHTIPVAGKMVKEKITISLDAFSQLNKGKVTYEGDIESMDVAAGIALHSKLGIVKTDKKVGYMAYAEDALSDAGLNSGKSYVGVVWTTSVKEVKQDAVHVTSLFSYKKGGVFTYYFGAGWSKWGFDSDDEWFNYVSDFASKVRKPLSVRVVER
jgi:hypothetical protein